jgi:hypothetical protein
MRCGRAPAKGRATVEARTLRFALVGFAERKLRRLIRIGSI